MPVQRRKKSKSRRDSRRATYKLARPHLVRCPQCKEMKRAHRACPHCGSYKGQEVIRMETV